jgi:hypothetical protein
MEIQWDCADGIVINDLTQGRVPSPARPGEARLMIALA